MTNAERRLLKELISERQEIAFHRLKDNAVYLELCKRQAESEQEVDKLYQKFTRDERLRVRRHYEEEMYKEGFELDEVYIQGVRDCFAVLSAIGAFATE